MSSPAERLHLVAQADDLLHELSSSCVPGTPLGERVGALMSALGEAWCKAIAVATGELAWDTTRSAMARAHQSHLSRKH